MAHRLPALTAFMASLVVTTSCYDPSISDSEREAVMAAVGGWTAVIGRPDEHECGVDLVSVVHASVARFENACKIHPGPGGASACLAYRPVGLRRSAPIIVLAPGLDEGAELDAVIHETMHALIACELPRSVWDPFDGGHTDNRVWAAVGGAGSAQAIARAMLPR